MNKVIIYPNPQTGHLALIAPVSDCGISLEEIAKKDVPAGLPYLFVDKSELPVEHEFFEAWEADFTTNHGRGMGSHAWFIQQCESQIEFINNMPVPEKCVDETDEEYSALIELWKAAKANQIAGLNKMIETQRAEMSA